LPDATAARHSLPCSKSGWGILAEPPGSRDLAESVYWATSLERSRRRRLIRREPRVLTNGRARISLALATAALGGPAAGVASAESSSGSLGVANLSIGSRGAAVTALQQELGVPADGIFGPQTERAVLSFQRSHGVPTTGLVGPLTRAALGQSGGSSNATTGSEPDGPTTTGDSLAQGEVKAMQSALGVTADGVIGPQTRSALRSFESSHGLPADGQPDPQALEALGVNGKTSDGKTTSGTPTTPTSPSSNAQTAVNAALSKVGSSYSYAGVGPSSFDCSGLVMWAERQAGVSVPHSSYAQYGLGTAVSSSEIQAGDLVFFDTAGGGPSDVGIATSPTTAVSATTHGVMTHSIHSGYWGSHYVGARRLGSN
jgi:cell wall-associated NlpC family hydrolase